MQQDLTLALISDENRVGNPSLQVSRMRHWISEARAAGADMVCFPEMGVTGYAPGSLALRASLERGDALIRELQPIADADGMAILAGAAIAAPDENRLHACHFAILPGESPFRYTKIHLAPPEHGVYASGSDPSIFMYKGWRIGIQLCYDAHFPLLSTKMALSGVDLILVPHASPRGTPQEKLESWMRHLPARAFDNSVFVAACNAVGELRPGVSFPGVCVVIGPDGRIQGQWLGDAPGMLVSTLSRETLESVRSHPMRFFLAQHRMDYL